MTERTTRHGDACDLLAAYELGLLAEDERQSFERHLGGCEPCREEMYAHAPAAVVLTSEPGALAEAAARARPRAGLAHRLRDLLRPAAVRVLVPVATVAVLAVLVMQPWRGAEPGWAELAQVEPAAWTGIQVRAGAPDAERRFAEAMELYATGAWSGAASALSAVETDLAAHAAAGHTLRPGLLDQASLYAGVSLLLAGEAAAALAPLERAAASTIGPVRDQAWWYAAQGHLLTEDPRAALAVLAHLQHSPVYAQPAARLAATIEDLFSNR